MMTKKRSGSLRVVWGGVLFLGAGIAIASSAALAAPTLQQAAPPAAAQQKSNSQYAVLPDGPGKDTLIRVCSKCHSPTNVVANGQTRDGWEDTLTKMAGLGASASDEEFTEILDYLVKNFPPVTKKINMNKATASELESQLGFTAKQAENIVVYREKNGAFKTSDDVKHVPDLNANDVDARRNRMTFQ